MDTREATYAGRRTDGAPVWRPVSPHLQVYDMLQMSSSLSIMHRITGAIWSMEANAIEDAEVPLKTPYIDYRPGEGGTHAFVERVNP